MKPTATRKMLGPPRASLKTAIAHHYIMAPEERRATYAQYKRMLIRSAAEMHERAAFDYANEGAFEIPQNRGFIKFPPGTFDTSEIVQLAREQIARVRPDEQKAKRKAQLRTGNLDNSTLDLQSAYLKFALQPGVLAAVAKYLGTAPLLTQVDVWYSVFNDTGKLENSQLYHCDWTDTRQVKLFIFATDVDEESGPLVVMGADTSEKVRERTGYSWNSRHNKLPDDEVYAAVGRGDEHAMTGPAGTVALMDTSRCFHYGSRVAAESEPRILVLMQYLTPTAFSFPPNFREAIPFHRFADDSSLTPLQRLALGGRL